MRRVVVMLVAVAALFTLNVASAEQAPTDRVVQNELRRLVGVWQEVARQREGQTVPVAQLGVLSQSETGETMTRLGEQVVYKGTTSLDPTRTPKTIDYVQTSESSPAGSPGDVRLGIYEISGDSFESALRGQALSARNHSMLTLQWVRAVDVPASQGLSCSRLTSFWSRRAPRLVRQLSPRRAAQRAR